MRETRVDSFICDVKGIPLAQGRPRFFRRGKMVGCYDPARSKSWKETVKWQAIEQKAEILPNALSMRLSFRLPRPKSLPKKVKEHTRKPDLDNLVKAVKDALKGVCYKDDAQIVELVATKQYNENTGVMINIATIKD